MGDKLGKAAMNPERLQQVYELYHAARECEPGERAALLAQADPELRCKVESLLAQGSHEGVLDRPALEGAPSLLEPSSAQLMPGTQLGPYKIEAPIGAGGMGEVYRARDTKLKRDVAIKVLPAAFASDPERRCPVQARGGSTGVAQSSWNRGDLRRRRPGPGHGAGRRPDLGRPHRQGPHPRR